MMSCYECTLRYLHNVLPTTSSGEYQQCVALMLGLDVDVRIGYAHSGTKMLK
jgi:hypothetical protein